MADVLKSFDEQIALQNGLKPCDVPRCPCCQSNTNQRQVSPQCIQSHDEGGGLGEHILMWHCNICGCEWTHGQFDKKETHAPADFISIRAGGTMTIDGRTYDVTSVTSPIPNPYQRFTIGVVLKITEEK